MRETEAIDNGQDVIDSRDVIARIEYLQSLDTVDCDDCDGTGLVEGETEPVECSTCLGARSIPGQLDEDEAEELRALKALQDEAETSPDWPYGETLIREDYFTKYIEELIDDCYEMPKEVNSGNWPWRHMTIDYEAAADEAKADYMEVSFDGVTYYIRA